MNRRLGRIGSNKKAHHYSWWASLFSNSTASRNFNMGILRIPFLCGLCGLRLAKTILCLRASPGLRFSPRNPLTFLMSIATWPGTQQDCQIKKTPFQVSLLFGSFLSSQVHHRPGCLSYGKSKGFPFYNDLQPAETILCFRAKYFGVCELNFRVGMGATTTSCRCWLPFNWIEIRMDFL